MLQKIKCFFGFHNITAYFQEWTHNTFDIYPIVKCGCELGPFKIRTFHADYHQARYIRQKQESK